MNFRSTNKLNQEASASRFLSRCISRAAVCLLMLTIAFGTSVNSLACPFCSSIALTFTEQLGNSDIAVVAKLIKIPDPGVGPDDEFPKATFEIVGVLKGKEIVANGTQFKTQLVGSYPEGQNFLVMGVDPPNVAWTTPMKTSDRVAEYLEKIQKLPADGPERLAFFQNYFEDKESVLAFDAYDEFAKAPYEDLIKLKDQMAHDKLIGWLKDRDISHNRKRLYYTMLGVCGTKDDIALLEEFINSGSRKKRAGLDALIACYLNLKGADGVDLIEKTFLIDKEVDYVDTLAAVSALRFHGTEVDFVPKERIVKAIRHLLDRPKMADMIIPDLARWKDWSVMDRLVTMFKEADADSNWLRVPVITYLRACPKPKAEAYIEELRKIDPEAVKRADFFLGFEEDGEDDWDDEPETESDAAKEKENSETEKTDESIGKNDSSTTSNVGIFASASETYVVKKVATTQDGESFVSDQIDNTSAIGTFATQQDAAIKSADKKGQNEGSAEKTLTSDPGPNTTSTEFVSSNADSLAQQTQPKQVAQSAPVPAPVAAVDPTPNLTFQIIFIPMCCSVVIFVLLWSVVNGWFERLIF
ncbi:MAG: hypothetical protein AB8B55_19310 [Mariniblastus sp.]